MNSMNLHYNIPFTGLSYEQQESIRGQIRDIVIKDLINQHGAKIESWQSDLIDKGVFATEAEIENWIMLTVESVISKFRGQGVIEYEAEE